MKLSAFQKTEPQVAENERLRIPQREGSARIAGYYAEAEAEREIGIVLPVGCGKSGLIALAPFALKSKRTLVIAPNCDFQNYLSSNLQR